MGGDYVVEIIVNSLITLGWSGIGILMLMIANLINDKLVSAFIQCTPHFFYLKKSHISRFCQDFSTH